MIRLSKAHIIVMHDELIRETGGSGGIRDEGLLDSALNAAFQSFAGEDVYPTLQEKAARLGYGLTKNHAFVDGNKRIGAHAMLAFLELNDIVLECTEAELTALFLGIAASEVSFEQMVEWVYQQQYRKERS